MQLMRRQLGVLNFVPLRQLFVAIATASHGIAPGLPSAPPHMAPLLRPGSMPRLITTLPALVERLKAAYVLVTGGKFEPAFEAFREILRGTTLTVVEGRQQVGELKELVGICREYLTAIRLELERKKAAEPSRQIELAAYFTHCNLQQAHTMLSLKAAMTAAFKMKLLTTAGAFARRLLEMTPRPDLATQARKVIQLSEQQPGDAFKFEYDERNPFVLCNATLTPIYRGSALVRCCLCKASYLPSYKGTLCKTCDLAEVGGDAPGIDESAVLARTHE